MRNDYYTAEQVAERLGLHVRTVRNYIQDGRLPAVRIGKQYRITPDGLAALTGDTPPDPTHIDVTSIVTVQNMDHGTASRLASFLQSAATARTPGERLLQIDTAYDESARSVKVVVIGGPGDAAEVLRLVESFVEGSR